MSGSEPEQVDPAPAIFDEMVAGRGNPLEPGEAIPEFEPWGLIPPPPLTDMLTELTDSVDETQLLHITRAVDAEMYAQRIGRHVAETGEGEE